MARAMASTASSVRTTWSPTTTARAANAWAVDTEKRTFTVHKNHDGSYTLLRRDRGTFLTNAGQSPGACETTKHHGATVVAGVKGRFHGYLRGKVTGGTFNPNATCPADCGFTDVWIATFFGPSATFSCFDELEGLQVRLRVQRPQAPVAQVPPLVRQGPAAPGRSSRSGSAATSRTRSTALASPPKGPLRRALRVV